ncbi:hypothetical protein [Turicibacter sanguinis]|nr:hypothetical protein [Turicibacter sanguinis]
MNALLTFVLLVVNLANEIFQLVKNVRDNKKVKAPVLPRHWVLL